MISPRFLVWFYAIHTAVLVVATVFVMLDPSLRTSVALLQFVSFYALILSCAGALQAALAQREARKVHDEVGDN